MQYEKKKITVTFRMTESEHNKLKHLAAEQNQSLSQYIVERVFQNDGITDTQLRQVYLSLAKIRDAVEYQVEADQAVKNSIFKECELIWQSLKS